MSLNFVIFAKKYELESFWDCSKIFIKKKQQLQQRVAHILLFCAAVKSFFVAAAEKQLKVWRWTHRTLTKPAKKLWVQWIFNPKGNTFCGTLKLGLLRRFMTLLVLFSNIFGLLKVHFLSIFGHFLSVRHI